jgi:hypothetical protein
MRVGREAGARSPRRILQEAPSICNVPDATLTSNQVPTLRITHSAGQVEAALEGEGPRKIERRPFTFTLSPQEAEDIRWYLEDYRIYPVDPAPMFAQRIEQRMGELGRELFKLVLAGSDVWEGVRRNLNGTRIEIETEVEDALVPWELMRDPAADLPLALEINSLVPPMPPSRATATQSSQPQFMASRRPRPRANPPSNAGSFDSTGSDYLDIGFRVG